MMERESFDARALWSMILALLGWDLPFSSYWEEFYQRELGLLWCHLFPVGFTDSSLCCGGCQEWKVFQDFLALKDGSISGMTQLQMSQTHHSMNRDFDLLEMIWKPLINKEKRPKFSFQLGESQQRHSHGMWGLFRIYWNFFTGKKRIFCLQESSKVTWAQEYSWLGKWWPVFRLEKPTGIKINLHFSRISAELILWIKFSLDFSEQHKKNLGIYSKLRLPLTTSRDRNV